MIGVVPVGEIVHHELEPLHRQGGDVDQVALFEQPLVGMHDLKRLRGIPSLYTLLDLTAPGRQEAWEEPKGRASVLHDT